MARAIRNVTYDFSGQAVLVTGAGRGQGKAHALSFARAGADVVLVDIGAQIDSVPYELTSREELEAVAAEVEALGAAGLVSLCDIRDADQVQATVDAALSRFGKIDVLINNAGIESVYPSTEMPEQAWDDMLDTNLRASFLFAKRVAPGMIERRRGKIINTASTAAFIAIPQNAHYVAAKHGLLGLTKALALDFAPHGINVNCVCPGAIDTPMNEGLFAAHEEWISGLGAVAGPWNLFAEDPSEQPMLEPEEISHAMLWLASDASDFVTGTAIVVDAGLLVK